MAEVEITYEFIREAMLQPGVAAACRTLAEKGAREARRIAAEEDVEMDVTVESGVRPGGRPFANIVGDNVDQEFGTSKTARRRILGRAGEAL